MIQDLSAVLEAALTDEDSGWSMGSFGAICEFHHVEGDPPSQILPGCGIVNPRGGFRLDRLEGARAVVWEETSPRPDRWRQSLAICLPAAEAAMAGRSGLTELGPDREALRPEDREAILFDLGLSLPQVDYCIRTADPELLAVLRKGEGLSVFDPANPAMPAILPRHPPRLAITKIGRMEVFQKIGGPDTGGVSPIGPHTHLLPQLMRSGRTHSANTPIPEGWTPVAGFHPASPVMDRLGEDRAFDRARFEAFQRLLEAWGDPESLALKRRVRAALEAGIPPGDLPPPSGRFAKAALRVALRQAARLGGGSETLALWRQAYDREVDESSADPHAH